MSDSMSGINVKLGRAQRHMDELLQGTRDFFADEPFVVEREEETSGRVVFRVRVREQPPLELSAALGDAVHALRSSLDYLAWQLVLVNGGQPSKATYFPIADTEKKFIQALPSALHGASKLAKDAVRGLRPHKDGNSELWLLHQLDIVDKHHLLLTVGCAYRSFSLDFSKGLSDVAGREGFEHLADLPEMRLALRPKDRLFPLADGDEVFAIEPAAREGHEMDPQFEFELAFAYGGILAGEIVTETIVRIHEKVWQVVNQLAPYLEGKQA